MFFSRVAINCIDDRIRACDNHDPSLAGDFDKWMKLAEFYSKRHDERRSYEWKITLGFWAVIFATLFKEIVNTPRIPFVYWPIALAFFTVFWTYFTWFRNKEDILRQQYAERMATTTNDRGDFAGEINPFTVRKRPWDPRLIREFMLNWARLFQIGTTAGIMWMAWGKPAWPWGDFRIVDATTVVVLFIGIAVGSTLESYRSG